MVIWIHSWTRDVHAQDLVATKMELALLHEQLLLVTHARRGMQQEDGRHS